MVMLSPIKELYLPPICILLVLTFGTGIGRTLPATVPFFQHAHPGKNNVASHHQEAT